MALEPRLTDKRFIGTECKRCGTHVKRKSDGYCIQCAQAPTDASRKAKREWHRANYAKSKEIKLRWLAANPGAVAERNIKYSRAIEQQTPIWADRDRINQVYLAARASGLTVDHIVPLRGRTVCGLHVHDNMQLLTHSENCSKRNRHEP